MAIKIQGSTIIDDSRKVIDASHIGIGTTNPTAELDVRGDVNVSGVATIASLDVDKLSPDGSDFGTTNYVPVADGNDNWSWQPVTSAGAGVLDGIIVKDEGSTVGTAGSITTLDFRGSNITATSVTGGAIATITASDTPTFDTLTVTGVVTADDQVSIASTVGIGTRIDIVPYDTLDNGTLSFEGSAGQLFSITNNLSSGSIFSVNDVSGIPSIDVDADGTIQLAPYGSTEYVGIGTTNPTAKLDVNGSVNVSGGNLSLGDDDRLRLGDGNDLQIYHNGTHGFIENTTGSLYIRDLSGGDVRIQGKSGEDSVICHDDGAVELYYDNSKKFETTGAGVTITGIATAATFYAQGGTYNAGADTATDAAIIIEADDVIYTRDTSSGYLRNLIGKQSNAISIGQQNTSLISEINLKPGNASSNGVKLHAGGTGDNVKLQTTSGGVTVTGNVTADGLRLGDSDYAYFGDGNDLQIYHDGSNSSIVDTGTGKLLIWGNDAIFFQSTGSGDYFAKFNSDAAVELYYDNSKKFETRTDGIKVLNGASETSVISGPTNLIIDPSPDDVVAITTGAISAAGVSTITGITTTNIVIGNEIQEVDSLISSGTTVTSIGTNEIGISKTSLGNTSNQEFYFFNASPTGVVRIKGDLYVDGTTTEINSTTLTIDDLNIVVASGATNSTAADGAGITVDGAGADITYQASNDTWVFNKAPYYSTARLLTTDDEGSGNGLDADTVDGIQASSFLRSDSNDSSTALYSFAAGGYSANVTYGGRSITTNLDINSTSMRGGVLVRNANDFRAETDAASFMHYDAYNTSATSYAFRAAKGTTLADTFWVKGDGNAYFSGSVGIGETAPNSKLHLKTTSGGTQIILETAAALDNSITFNEAGSNYFRILHEGSAGSSPDNLFKIQTATSTGGINNDAITIKQSGDVGIGTTSPEYTLDFGETSASTIRLVSENNGTAIRVGAGGGNNDVTLLRVDAPTSNPTGESNSASYGFSLKYMGSRVGNDNSLSIFSDNQTGTAVEAFTMLQDGKIGINSSSPTAKLDVNGDVAIASTVSIGTTIDIVPYNDLGMLSFEASQGQLFAITNNLSSGSIFSVNPISGIPIIDVHADRTIRLNPYGGKTGIGITNPNEELHVLGAAVISSDTATIGSDYATLTVGERPALDGYASIEIKNDSNSLSAKIDGTSAGLNIWSNKNSINGERFMVNGGSSTEFIALRPRSQDVLRAQHDGTNGKVVVGSATAIAAFTVDNASGDEPCVLLPDTTNSRYAVGFGNVNVVGVGQRLDFYAGDSGANGTNLSSSHRRMSLTGAGDVGIGTDNPSKKLHVYGDGTALFGPGSAYGKYLQIGANNSSAPDSNTANIEATNGNLHLDSAEGGFGIYLNFYGGTAGTLFGNGASGNVGKFSSGGVLTINTTSETGTASQNLQVNGGGYISGNLGVGATNPQDKLRVYGKTWLDNASGDGQSRADGLTVSNAPGSNWTPGTDASDTRRNTTFATKGSTRPVIVTWRNIDDTSGAYWDFVADANTDKFYIQRGGAYQPTFTWDTNHQVAIGTDVQSGSTLAVGGTITELYNGSYWNVVTQADVGYGASQVPLNQYLGQLAFLDDHHPNGLRRDGGGSDDVSVTSAGNVGIGITNPGAKLDVYGTARIGGTASDRRRADFDTNGILTLAYGDNNNVSNLVLQNTATDATTNHGNSILWQFGTNASSTPINAGKINIIKEQQWTSTGTTQDSALTIDLAENGSLGEKVRITSAGNFGINETSPSYQLHVGGDIKLADTGTLWFSDTSGSVEKIVATTSTLDYYADGSHRFYESDASAERVTLDVNNASGRLYFDGDSNTYFTREATDCHVFVNAGSESVRINASGDVGIGTDAPSYKLHVNGSFAATTKSFVIDHPTKDGMKLRYGSLEGPENGVYVRGRLKGNNTIELPDYWTGLVDEETITVNLTPIGRKAPLHSVVDIADNTVVVESANDVVDCFYTVFGERKDVEKLEVEF